MHFINSIHKTKFTIVCFHEMIDGKATRYMHVGGCTWLLSLTVPLVWPCSRLPGSWQDSPERSPVYLKKRSECLFMSQFGLQLASYYSVAVG